ncbi:MAG: hypothetical protein Q8P65_00640 [bacterium]|nr:hypothetical protein [bacterium]
MQHRQLQKKFSKSKFVIFFLLILTSFFISLFFFKIQKINFKTKIKDSNFLGKELILGKNLLFLNIYKLSNDLSELNPKIIQLKIYKVYPNKILILYELDKPIAVIKANEGYLFLSDKGKILRRNKNIEKDSKLTQINYYQKFDYLSNTTGSFIDFIDLKYSLSVLTKLKKYKNEVLSIDISRPSMIRFNLGDSVVIFTSEKPIDEQINKLEKIILQFKVEGNNFSLLDLRFDKPVLKYK